jgi:hypothetical protein
MDLSNELRKTFRQTVIISGAMAASLLVYAVVLEVIRATIKPFQGFWPISNSQAIRYLFYGAAVAVIVLIRLLSRALLKSGPQEGPSAFFNRLARATILTAALSEIPVVLGFVLFILTGSSRDFYYLFLVSLVLEFMYFPRYRYWEDLVSNRFPSARLDGGRNV